MVDTAHFNDKTRIDNLGHPHSDAIKPTKRFHRRDHEHLQIEFVIEDPKSYTSPWTLRYHYDWKPNWEIGEAFCIPEDQQRFLQKNVPETTGKSTPEN